jgi:hypothetical protein
MTASTPLGPAEGVLWKPGRSGNTVSWDGGAVVKIHARGAGPGLRELAALARLSDVPVPRVLPGTTSTVLRLGFVEGLSAIDAIDGGHASAVLRAMGESLRDLHRIDPRRFGPQESAGGARTLIHGDFAPYNVIVSSEGAEVRAILDWEMADVGDPMTDLAWCEAQFVRLCPRHLYALPHLFAGYGATPPRAVLDTALADRMSQLSSGRGHAGSAIQAEVFRSITFSDRTEAAAFVAALSRASSGPEVGSTMTPAQIWAASTSNGGVRVLLNETATAVATRVFHARVETDQVEIDGALVFLAGHMQPMGVSDALKLL